MGKGDEVAKRIRFGRRAELPLCALGGYILSGGLLCIGGVQDLGGSWRGPLMFAAIIAFLAGAVIHIVDKIDRHDAAMTTKIDDSVGDVYDAGERAGHRHLALEVEAPGAALAVVHDLGPRR